MFRRIIFVLLIIAVFGFPAISQSVINDGVSPSFRLPNLEGESVELEQYLGKNIIVLSFFASWSESCQQEIVFLQKLSKEYKSTNLKVIGVSFDRKLNSLKQFVNENKIEFEILHDKKLATLKEFKILIIPTLFVIDQEGNLKNIYIDFDENVKEALSKEIQKLLYPPKNK